MPTRDEHFGKGLGLYGRDQYDIDDWTDLPGSQNRQSSIENRKSLSESDECDWEVRRIRRTSR